MTKPAAPAPPSREAERCDHKFVDSKHCLKCGWVPPASREAAIAAREIAEQIVWNWGHGWYDGLEAQDAKPLIDAITAALQQARQERDEWKRRAEDAEGRIANALA